MRSGNGGRLLAGALLVAVPLTFAHADTTLRGPSAGVERTVETCPGAAALRGDAGEVPDVPIIPTDAERDQAWGDAEEPCTPGRPRHGSRAWASAGSSSRRTAVPRSGLRWCSATPTPSSCSPRSTGPPTPHFVTVDRGLERRDDQETAVHTVHGDLFSASSNDLCTMFDHAGDPRRVVIHLSDSHRWDASTVAAPDSVTGKYAHHGKDVRGVGLDEPSRRMRVRRGGMLSGEHWSAGNTADGVFAITIFCVCM